MTRKRVVNISVALPEDAAAAINRYAEENWMVPQEALYEMIRAGIEVLADVEIERED